MKYFLIVTTAALGLSTAPIIAQNTMEQMENVTIDKIKRIQFKKNSATGVYYVEMDMIIKNANGSRVGMKDYKFDVKMKPSCGSDLVMTVGRVITTRDITFEAASAAQETLEVKLGTNQAFVLNRLADILNILGDPANEVCLILQGPCKVGVESKRGWYFQDNMEINLRFQPKIQREVLVE